ncbi:hypothetical protein HanIR_Chr05g0222811 [Helianthus annuus]|nr:hypothetical protein HanIR_Chr05g0222811 [Helianthus annuus]
MRERGRRRWSRRRRCGGDGTKERERDEIREREGRRTGGRCHFPTDFVFVRQVSRLESFQVTVVMTAAASPPSAAVDADGSSGGCSRLT